MAVFEVQASARQRTYLRAAGGDSGLAAELYVWNGQLAAALSEVLGHVECCLRATMDPALREWNEAERGKPRHWALPGNAASPLARRPTQRKLEKAHCYAATSLRRSGGSGAPTHDDVVAQLSFGFWPTLLPARRSSPDRGLELLWETGLAPAFPCAVSKNKEPHEIRGLLDSLVQLRNRIAHQENLLEVDGSARLNDALVLLATIDQELADEVAAINRVREAVANDPRRHRRARPPNSSPLPGL